MNTQDDPRLGSERERPFRNAISKMGLKKFWNKFKTHSRHSADYEEDPGTPLWHPEEADLDPKPTSSKKDNSRGDGISGDH